MLLIKIADQHADARPQIHFRWRKDTRHRSRPLRTRDLLWTMGVRQECTLRQAPLHLLLDTREVCVCASETETSQATKTPLTSGNVNFTNEYLETDKPVHSCLVHVNAVLHPAGAPQGPAQLAVPVTTGETTHGPEQSRCSPVHTNWGSAVLSPRYFYCQPYGQTDSLFLMLLWALFIVFFQRTMNSPFVSDQKKQLFCVLCHCLPLSYVNKPSYITAQPTWFISVNKDIDVYV